MRDRAALGPADIADAYMGWWALAGVDSAVSEIPYHWLKPAIASAPAALPSSIVPAAVAQGQRWPDQLDAFIAHLANGEGEPERAWGSVVPPAGPQNAPLMVVSDVPDTDDVDAGMLLAGEAGKLFDAMLAAMGLNRQGDYGASLCAARPLGGLWRAGEQASLAARMRHHIGLVAPGKLLILGDRTAQLLLDAENRVGDGGLRFVNHDGVKVEAGAISHPRMLLRRPADKAECWRVMQYLIGDGH